MSKQRARRQRKQRRNIRKILKHGVSAAPRQTLISGRTGKAHSKKTRASA